MTDNNDNKQTTVADKVKRVKSQRSTLKRLTNQTKCTSKCSNCGGTKLHDITETEFPGKKALIFECLSCGNNSIQSNVSADERRQRLAVIAKKHLDIIECRFCCQRLPSQNDYFLHLRNEHRAKKNSSIQN